MVIEESIVPSVIFGFNRPDRLHQVLTALKAQRAERLVIFIDGPRNAMERVKVEQCQQLAKQVDWVPTELHFHTQNQGLLGLIDNIDTVFEHYNAAIFIEDDCVPMPGLHSFMYQSLEHYQAEKRVFSIGGHQFLSPSYFRRYSYSLVSTWRFDCWGWATWRDRWHQVKQQLPHYPELFDNLRCMPDTIGDDVVHMARACAEQRLDSWAIPVSVVTLSLKMVHLLPTKGLIRNTGIGSGTHPRPNAPFSHNRNVHRHTPAKINWLENVEPTTWYVQTLEAELRRNHRRTKYYQAMLRKWSTIRSRLVNVFTR